MKKFIQELKEVNYKEAMAPFMLMWIAFNSVTTLAVVLTLITDENRQLVSANVQKLTWITGFPILVFSTFAFIILDLITRKRKNQE